VAAQKKKKYCSGCGVGEIKSDSDILVCLACGYEGCSHCVPEKANCLCPDCVEEEKALNKEPEEEDLVPKKEEEESEVFGSGSIGADDEIADPDYNKPHEEENDDERDHPGMADDEPGCLFESSGKSEDSEEIPEEDSTERPVDNAGDDNN
jgi:hypothetical protein